MLGRLPSLLLSCTTWRPAPRPPLNGSCRVLPHPACRRWSRHSSCCATGSSCRPRCCCRCSSACSGCRWARTAPLAAASTCALLPPWQQPSIPALPPCLLHSPLRPCTQDGGQPSHVLRAPAHPPTHPNTHTHAHTPCRTRRCASWCSATSPPTSRTATSGGATSGSTARCRTSCTGGGPPAAQHGAGPRPGAVVGPLAPALWHLLCLPVLSAPPLPAGLAAQPGTRGQPTRCRRSSHCGAPAAHNPPAPCPGLLLQRHPGRARGRRQEGPGGADRDVAAPRVARRQDRQRHRRRRAAQVVAHHAGRPQVLPGAGRGRGGEGRR